MTVGRVVGTVVSCGVVAGCAALVVGMTGAANPADREPQRTSVAAAAPTSRPAFVPRPGANSPGGSGGSSGSTARPRAVPRTSAPALRTTAAPDTNPSRTTFAAPGTSAADPSPAATRTPARSTVRPAPRTTARPAARSTARTTARATPRPARKAHTAHTAHKASGVALPLRYRTYSATRVITVTAHSYGATRATLQAWTKVGPGRWKRYGAPVGAWVGSDGIGRASESTSKTPAGSFTVTQAFGRYSDPGTQLRYFRTTPSDYWMSSPGRLYNTHQRCGSCGYNNGVNERLYYVTPYYNYAAVIDYNTRNAPGGVHQGRGSAFFLHVAVGAPTAGCVAIPQSKLVQLLRWMTPRAHPRILIGVT